jgi:hypothetical protein
MEIIWEIRWGCIPMMVGYHGHDENMLRHDMWII